MFHSNGIHIFDRRGQAEISIGTETAMLNYRDVMEIAAALESWLQRTADENVGVWAFHVPRTADERAA